MVLADAGEDGIVECASCDYAANMEKAERRFPGPSAVLPCGPAPRSVATPGQRTIEAVSAFLKIPPSALVKTMIYIADGKPVAAMVPGDRDVNERKLARALGADTLALADDETIRKVTGAPVGYAGPVGLAIPAYADKTLEGCRGVAVGANAADAHLVDVDLARDASAVAYHDLAIAREGDGCPRCDGTLREKRGIEVGHVFKLGTKYSQILDASYLDAAGQKHPMIMGCYGIGVTRTLQAIIEQSHDESGIVWPMSIAPCQVAILPLNAQHEESMRVAESLAASLEQAGIDVLFDDRDERAGVKLKDADLLGVPVRVVVSERSLADGKIELKLRTEKKAALVPVGEAANSIGSLVL